MNFEPRTVTMSCNWNLGEVSELAQGLESKFQSQLLKISARFANRLSFQHESHPSISTIHPSAVVLPPCPHLWKPQHSERCSVKIILSSRISMNRTSSGSTSLRHGCAVTHHQVTCGTDAMKSRECERTLWMSYHPFAMFHS